MERANRSGQGGTLMRGRVIHSENMSLPDNDNDSADEVLGSGKISINGSRMANVKGDLAGTVRL
jgi:hypothetical protein